MISVRRRILLAATIGALAGLCWLVNARLTISSDLRLFMPSAHSARERLILDEIGEGPASRLLLLAVTGGDPNQLAETSQRLARVLRESRAFNLVANGETDLAAIPERFLPYRYLLSPTLDTTSLDEVTLRRALAERARDFASPAGLMLEPWLQRDPTLEALVLAESWQPPEQPRTINGVWFDPAGQEALLLAETRAAGFDPQSQHTAQAQLRTAFERVRVSDVQRLELSGPGAFTVLMHDRTQRDTQWLGTIATLGMVALLLGAYRNVVVLLVSSLPLIAAGIVGLAAVSTAFGTVHAITLAFGFTLIGVAQDYPMHLFSHQHAGLSPFCNARQLWPTMATGVASTCVAYLAFLFSGVLGLAQVAVFTIVGLATAGLMTRFLLPAFVPNLRHDPANSAWLGRLWDRMARLPRPHWLGPTIALLCVGYLVMSPQPLWQNSLAGLMPIPGPLIERDTALRRALAAPDVRHLIVLEGDDLQSVLHASDAMASKLQGMIAAGALGTFDYVTRYLPPQDVQERRRARLPPADELRANLDSAVSDSAFQPGTFEPFLQDVEHARHLPPLDPALLVGTPLDARVGSLLLHHGMHWSALVTLTGVRDAGALADVAATVPGATFLDLKRASEDLVSHQRERILNCLAVASMLLIAVVAVALRDPRRVLRVLSPMALTTVMTLAILHVCGVALSLFHLIALILSAGLGLDYALFFEHAADDPAEQRRTLHAVLVCSLSTWMVFLLLAFMQLPVLRAIGVTVAIGVASNFVLALVITREGSG